MARLSDFRGVHHGEAIVVCGLGGSINSFGDPSRFRTIGVNDIGRAFTPDYMFCMDAPAAFPADRLQYIQGSGAQFIFTDHDLGIANENIVRFQIKRADAPRLDDPDALYFIGRPSTSPFMALCLAAHMGAKAIGLVGVDFTNGHFFAADGSHKLTGALAGIDKRFHLLGKALLDRGVKVFNLSTESRLRAFPRLTPDEFYALQRSGRSRSWTRPARRVYLQSKTQVGRNVLATAQLINTETTVWCRVIAPGSPDVAPGSMPELEQNIAAEGASSLTVKIDCGTVSFPPITTDGSNFLATWNARIRPLLFESPAPLHHPTAQRGLTFRVVVSQERATGNELAETVRSLWRDLLPGDDIVVVGRHGTSHDVPAWIRGTGRIRYTEQRAGESFIAARNRAASLCSQDILVFTDANIQAPLEWVAPLESAFAAERVAAVGPAIVDLYQPEWRHYGMKFADAELSTAWLPRMADVPYPVPLVPGVFLAVRRRVFEEIGGFDEGMRQTGADDLELCFRLWTAGFECFLAPELEVKWMNPFAAGAIRPEQYWADLLHNLLRLAHIHFGPERLGSFMQRASAHAEFAEARAGLLTSNSSARQRQVRQTRKYSDAWFFDRFGE